MDYGIYTVCTDESVGPAAMARLVESHGFESLFVPEHSHIPVNDPTPFPMGGGVPRHHQRILDPFVVLTAAAMATSTLRVATGVCLVTEREPIGLAKAVASLDYLSGGRVLFGIGAGWSRAEIRHHGIDPKMRMAVLRERVSALREIWTTEEAAFTGAHVNFGPILSWPKPVQQPHPPLMLGGNHPRVLERVLDLDVGWLPNVAKFESLDELERMIQDLRRKAEDRGFPCPPVTAFRADPTTEALETYRALGVERCVFSLHADSEQAFESDLHDLRSHLDSVGAASS